MIIDIIKNTAVIEVRSGVQGPRGPSGETTNGLPTGGTSGQVLVKASGTDFDSGWHTLAVGDIANLQSTLDGKASASDLTAHVADTANPHAVTKSQVGLGNVDNTADTDKPVSTAQQTALNAKADLVGGVIPTSQIPAIAITEFLGAVSSQSAMLALVGQKGDWCNRTDTSTAWVIIGNDPTQIASWGQINYPAPLVTSVNGQVGVVVLGKIDIGLSNVDNTSDAGKPVSAAQQAALDLKQDKADTLTALSGGFGDIGGFFPKSGIVRWNGTTYELYTDVLPPKYGGTGLSGLYQIGAILYANGAGAGTLAALDGNTSATPKYLTSTGTGLGAQAPAWSSLPVAFSVACSDETTSLTTGTAKVTFRMPYAMTLTAVRLSVNTAPTGAAIIVDVKQNGTSIFTTKPQIDAGSKTSVGGSVPGVLAITSLTDDAEITINLDQIGSTIAGKGLKLTLVGTR